MKTPSFVKDAAVPHISHKPPFYRWLLHLWGLMASQGFWDPRISVCFVTHYIFWWAVLKGLASHPIHPPPPPVCSWRSCQDGYNGTVCGMFSVADILHIADVIWRVVLMYSCCTFYVGRQWFGYFFFAKCMKFSAVLYCSTKLTQPHPRGFLVVVFFACDYPIAILLTSFSGNWKHLPNLVNNSSL